MTSKNTPHVTTTVTSYSQNSTTTASHTNANIIKNFVNSKKQPASIETLTNFAKNNAQQHELNNKTKVTKPIVKKKSYSIKNNNDRDLHLLTLRDSNSTDEKLTQYNKTRNGNEVSNSNNPWKPTIGENTDIKYNSQLIKTPKDNDEVVEEKTSEERNSQVDEVKQSKNKHAQLNSYVTSGISASQVTIEVAISPGISKFEIIGLGDTAIKESKERIIKAVTASGYSIPAGNITVNLAPAKTRKKGSLYDLPIALSLLIASKQVQCTVDTSQLIVAGELSLTGKVLEVDGLFATIVKILKSKKTMHLLVPQFNLKDCAPFMNDHTLKSIAGIYDKNHNLQFSSAANLEDAIEILENPSCAFKKNAEHLLHLKTNRNSGIFESHTKNFNDSPSNHKHLEQKNESIVKTQSNNLSKSKEEPIDDYAQVIGQENAKLALQLTASAGLNLLFVGPPGCGKSMLMRRLPGILPPLTSDNALELTLIEHAYGINKTQLKRKVPFREAHSNIPVTSLIGGGRNPKPGEISLAHNGFLFLDEISLFTTAALQSLRTPIEEKNIVINRLAESIQYPANFSLLACCNPCPCGFFGHKRKMCKCTRRATQKFFEKLSRPFIDRFHIILYINKIEKEDLNFSKSISTQQMKSAVANSISFGQNNKNKLHNITIKAMVEEHPLLKEMVNKALQHNVLSLRRVEAMVKVLIALMNHHQSSTFDKKMVLQAMELSSNKFLNLS